MTARHARRAARLGGAWAAWWLAAAAANAQTVLFITPEQPEVAVAQPVVIAAEHAPGQRVQWPADRLAWMFVRNAGGQRNFEPATPLADPGKPGPSITLDGLDAAMVGVELAPRDEVLDGKALAAWARENISPHKLPDGLDKLEGAGPVTVRRVESAKAFLRARGEGEQRRGNRPTRSATATDKSGQAVEIRPLFDVTAATTPTDIPVRMYAFGDGAKRALLRVVHVPTGEEQRLIADDKAIAFVRLEHPGMYRLEFHALAPFTPPDGGGGGEEAAGDAPKATWTLLTGTATFTVPQQPQVPQHPEPAKGERVGEEKRR